MSHRHPTRIVFTTIVLLFGSLTLSAAPPKPDFHLEARLHKAETPKAAGDTSLDELLGGFERDLIQDALMVCLPHKAIER